MRTRQRVISFAAAIAVSATGLLGAVLTESLPLAWASGSQALTVAVVNQDGDPLPSVVVALAPLDDETATSGTPGSVVIDQENTMFSPWVTSVAQGGSVRFANSDPFGHHIYSFSSVKRFERTVGGKASTDAVSFENSGVVPIGCNIHDDMLGYIAVVADPYFATTPNSGTVRFDGLAPGRYRVRLWHPLKQGRRWREEEIEIATGQDTDTSIALPLRQERQGRRRDRSSYR